MDLTFTVQSSLTKQPLHILFLQYCCHCIIILETKSYSRDFYKMKLRAWQTNGLKPNTILLVSEQPNTMCFV